MVTKTSPSDSSKTNDIDNRRLLFAKAVADVKKDFGDDSVVSAKGNLSVKTVSTGSWVVDSLLGGGFPKGRFVEIYGPEASGKTSLALNAIADVQKKGGNAVFIDLEQALDPSYASSLGVDIDNLYVSRPTSGEEAEKIMEKFIFSGVVDIIVLDSIAAMVSEKELSGDIDKDNIATRARLVGKMMGRLLSPIAKTGTVCILINQERQGFNAYGMAQKVNSGGNAIKYYASQRIRVCRQKPELDASGALIGTPVKVKVEKNKIAPPYREGEFWIMNGIGVDKVNELFDLCLKFGIFKRSGSFFKDGETGDLLGQGKNKVVAMLRANENGIRDKYEPLMLQHLHDIGADNQSIIDDAIAKGNNDIVDEFKKQRAFEEEN